MQVLKTDIAIIGAGGAGLRAAIAAAESSPDLEITLVSKVYPMRSHTVAAEGGSAGVIQDHDSLEHHFQDTVSGGDWLCNQDTVDYFVEHATEEMIQLEHWGCPWSRKSDGNTNVRAFGGMKIERTWFAADKTGFHMLHTLFQTSLKYPSIKRCDEFFAVNLVIEDGRCQGLVAIELKTGEPFLIQARSVILATGGAGRLFQFNTNGGIVTGDGMAMAYRAGVALQDMEFVQYHPTGLPGSGILITEGCRGEGGILLNKDGYRYLQDYGLGPETPPGQPQNKTMELGPRDKLSQAFWHEQRQGRTIETPLGDAVHLDLHHLGQAKLKERLPMILSLAKNYMGIDATREPIPVRPAAHYTMGGIRTDMTTTSLPGLYAVGECSSVGIHGANRLGSNSLAELVVFGKVAGQKAAEYAAATPNSDFNKLQQQGEALIDEVEKLRQAQGKEKVSTLRKTMCETMENAFGIYRQQSEMQQGLDKITELKQRFSDIKIEDKSRVFNTELLMAFELKASLDVAETIALSSLNRKESRGAHQRLDEYNQRNDTDYLQHSLVTFQHDGQPQLSYEPVNITRYPPGVRAYGKAAETASTNDQQQENL